jgi:hypothetical protein
MQTAVDAEDLLFHYSGHGLLGSAASGTVLGSARALLDYTGNPAQATQVHRFLTRLSLPVPCGSAQVRS